MNIKLELLKSHIHDYIDSHITDFEVDANKIVNTQAICLLYRIQEIIKNNACSDFDAIEQIVELFEANGISCGDRHDFG